MVIEYRLSAQKMEIIARAMYRVIAMHRLQYGSFFAVFVEKSMPIIYFSKNTMKILSIRY